VVIDTRALVKPAVPEKSIHAKSDAVFLPVEEKVRQVKCEGRIAVVVPANKAAVAEDEGVPKGPIEIDEDTPA